MRSIEEPIIMPQLSKSHLHPDQASSFLNFFQSIVHMFHLYREAHSSASLCSPVSTGHNTEEMIMDQSIMVALLYLSHNASDRSGSEVDDVRVAVREETPIEHLFVEPPRSIHFGDGQLDAENATVNELERKTLSAWDSSSKLAEQNWLRSCLILLTSWLGWGSIKDEGLEPSMRLIEDMISDCELATTC